MATGVARGSSSSDVHLSEPALEAVTAGPLARRSADPARPRNLELGGSALSLEVGADGTGGTFENGRIASRDDVEVVGELGA